MGFDLGQHRVGGAGLAQIGGDDQSLDPEAQANLGGEGLKPVEIEVWLVCVELGIGGTLDLVARDKNNDLVLIDHKASRAVRDKYLLQVGCYDMLWDAAKAYLPWPHYNERIKRAYILRLDKATADFEVFPVFRTEAEREALREQCIATVKTYRWLREAGKILAKFNKKGKI